MDSSAEISEDQCSNFLSRSALPEFWSVVWRVVVFLFFLGVFAAVVTSEVLKRESSTPVPSVKRRPAQRAKAIPDVPASEAAALALSQAAGLRMREAERRVAG